jgi:deoxyribonuclease V
MVNGPDDVYVEREGLIATAHQPQGQDRWSGQHRGAYRGDMRVRWPRDRRGLEALQEELARSAPAAPRWLPPTDRPIAFGGLFFASSTRGPDGAWAGACVVQDERTISSAVVSGEPGAPYVPGYLALREEQLLELAARRLNGGYDVLMVNGTGRDHPRGAGLALHLGASLGVPTVGVTDRSLVAEAVGEPGEARGSHVPLVTGGETVGMVLRTRARAKPLVAHAAWQTEPDTAVAVVLGATGLARTPEPIRRARRLARLARARAEGHASAS